ncbi:MAG: M23 family metallopeptidase [Bacteroidia bacterium]|nr:M23 family metallopeptidase [Bacteroidia bacterium]
MLKLFLPSLLLMAAMPLYSQNSGFGQIHSHDPGHSECLNDEQRTMIMAKIEENRERLMAEGLLPPPHPEMLTLLNWPMQLRSGLNQYGYHSISGGVDHNPAYPNQLLDYNCGTRTYDTPSGYNHKGTDFFLWPFSWNKMDSLDVEIIAGAAGIIVYKSNGNFDRSCGFNNNNWNAVYVQHADGSVAWYGHMKNGSLTSKQVGDAVAQGEYLGVVGSSGNSTGPHLHLEVYDSGNNLIDPWQGSCNSMNSQSWWAAQRLYLDRAINHIQTNNAPPVFSSCPNQDIKNEQDLFLGTDTIFLMTYYRFLQNNDVVNITITQPNNAVWSSWPWTNTWGNFNAAYVYWWMIAGSNAMTGQWKFEATYNNITYTDYFWIGLTGMQSAQELNTNQPIELFSPEGKLLRRTTVLQLDPEEILRDLAPGMYIWRSADGRTGKLMKIK